MHFFLNVTFAALNFTVCRPGSIKLDSSDCRSKSGGVGNEDELLLISSGH